MLLKKILFLTLLIISTVLLWMLSSVYDETWLVRVFHTSLALTIIYATFSMIIDEALSGRIKDSRTRYSFKKTISILQIAAIVVVLIRIWVDDGQALLVSFGIIGAGIAIALQDVFKNFAGGVILFTSGIYRAGDRIEIDGTTGDVIDIGIFYTTVLEIKGWVIGDQATGRLVVIPNGKVIGCQIFNYSKDHGYIWDELMFPIAFDSNWRKAKDIMLGVAREETISYSIEAEGDIERIGEKYYVPKVDLQPNVFIALTDNWVEMVLRYVTPVRRRRAIRDILSRGILEELEAAEDIRIASENIEISRFPSSQDQ